MINTFIKKTVVLSSALAVLAMTSGFAAISNVDSVSSLSSAAKLNKGFYLGAQAGYADMNYKKSWLTDDPKITSVGEVDDSGFAGRLFGGYNFNPYLAAEMGYVILPKVEFKDIALRDASTTVDESFDQSILDFVVKGTLPLKDGYDLYAKAGFANVLRDDLEASANGVTVNSNTSNSKNVPVLGAGANYHMTSNIITEVSFMYYFGNGDLEPTDFAGAGLIYQFG